MWAACENIRVILSRHKCSLDLLGTDVLVLAAQDTNVTWGNFVDLIWPCRGPRSSWFIGGYMLAKHLDIAMLHLTVAKSENSVIFQGMTRRNQGFVRSESSGLSLR